MSFRIEHLHLEGFRNYEDASLDLDRDLTILLGRNAVGKTSVIEAIQLLCEGVSFRHCPYPEMIGHQHEQAMLEMEARHLKGEPSRIRQVRALIEPHTKTYTVNGKQTSVREGIAGVIPVVVFTPDNLRLIKDAASRRRDEVDALGKQLSNTYARLVREYTKTLKGRNRLLTDGYFTDPAFDAWTEQLSLVGAALFRHRARLLERLTELARAQYHAIDATCVLRVTYENNWGALPQMGSDQLADRLHNALDEHLISDTQRKTTTIGPHRDEVVFTLDGHDARAFASQGQQRTIALAWKLAGADLIEELLGVPPILLLDDVMSELDEVRRRALVQRIGSDNQTVITTTNTHYFDDELLQRARIIEIGQGQQQKKAQNQTQERTPRQTPSENTPGENTPGESTPGESTTGSTETGEVSPLAKDCDA